MRSAYNYLCMMVITSMLLYYSLIDAQSRKRVIYPLLVEVLLIVGIIWAYVEVISDIYQSRCKNNNPKKNLAYQLFDDVNYLKKYESNLIRSDLFANRKLL